MNDSVGDSLWSLTVMTSYSNTQIVLHWAVAGMVVVQWATAGAIPRTHNPLLPATATDLLLHMLHNYNGMAIGLLVLLRVGLRLRDRRDRLSTADGTLGMAATAVHYGFYACLAAQAVTGFTASYLWGPAAVIHKLIWNVTLTLVVIHLAASLWHAVRGDAVLVRMVPSRRRVSGD